MDECTYCHEPIAEGRGFCSAECYDDYLHEMNTLRDGFEFNSSDGVFEPEYWDEDDE